MNLADANLKHVNTSRPTLVHSTSKQSVTASDDYYSLTSDNSSEGRRTAQNPEASSARTQVQNPTQNVLQSEATIPPLRPIKHTQQGSDTSDDKPSVPLRDSQHKIRRKPVSSSSSQGTVRRPLSEASGVTPGVDDIPNVRYALDSLTRDERAYPPSVGSELSLPTDGIAPYEAPSYHDAQAYREPSEHSSTYTPAPPIAASNVLLPTEPIGTESYRLPKLNFVPQPLRIIPLACLIFGCVLMIAALIFCAVWPNSHPGLFAYDGTGTSRYFVFQYLPQLVASFIIIWLLIIQSAIHRIFPFITLASGPDEHISSVLHDSKLFITNYLIPNLTYFRHREPVLGLVAIIFWLALFTVPLQSSLFQSRYTLPDGVWKWTTVQPIAWTLFALYVLLIAALILLLLRFALYETGLKWDPVSLADIIVVFRQSNILADFETCEIDPSALSRQRPKSLRLGYWKTARRDSETFYCIGDENAPTRHYSIEHGKMQPAFSQKDWSPESKQAQKSSTNDTLQSDIHEPAQRYRWTPWFLKDTFIVLWIVVAVVLLVAFLVVSFVNGGVKTGFLPLLPAPASSQGFSPANFLYSFLPSLLGMLLFLLFQPIDQYFRALQPFASLMSHDGSSAEHSLLLNYNACLPFDATIHALFAGHFQLAWISFIALSSIVLPILAGGVFTAQFNIPTQSVRMEASMPGYEALCVFLILYILSFLVIWPRKKRHLPHDISTLGQLVSYFYQSPILRDAPFRAPRSKVDLVTKLISTPIGETSLPMYSFGIYIGLDGREHLGIDRIERSVDGEKAVGGAGLDYRH